MLTHYSTATHVDHDVGAYTSLLSELKLVLLNVCFIKAIT